MRAAGLQIAASLLAKAGAGIIAFHREASRQADRALALIRDHGCQAGLAFEAAAPELRH